MLEFVNGTNVEQATTGLLNLLGGMMEQLANFLGTSVQFVQEHFMEYLLGFGRYHLINTCIERLIAAVGMFLISALVTYGIVCVFNANPSSLRGDDSISLNTLKKFLIAEFIIAIVVVVILIAMELTKYAVAPEIYSISAVLEKLGYLGD